MFFDFNVLTVAILFGGIGLVFQAIIGFLFFVSSIYEREKRASWVALIQFVGMTLVLVFYLYLAITGFFHESPGFQLFIIGFILALVALFLLIKRDKPNQRALQGSSGYIVGQVERFDERCLVFARNRALPPGSDVYKEYYRLHPEHEKYDTKRRQKGGINGEVGKLDYPNSGFETAMALSCLSACHYLNKPEMIRPEASIPARHYVKFEKPFSAEEATKRVKGFTRKLGANLVGVAEINPNWIYSNRGEIFNNDWENWGQPIELDHKYVIVFAEEMDLELTMTAPHTTTLIESMRDYAKGSFISVQLAAFIANLGYSATANHLRHYELILPPVAVDAGIGELSRMGYVMTREFGPRVRLSAVTTDMPLVCDKPVDLGIQSFCKVCKKCAVCCPSKSIPEEDDPKEFNGTLRWKLQEESCFNYWATVGSDCNICMRVCPWSHARTWPHRLVVFLTQRNKINQQVFTLLDNIFYGRKLGAKSYPHDWAGF